MGLGSEITEKRVPFLHEKLTKLRVVDFDCGANHCIALTAGGEVLTWGLGTDKYGFLGREKMDKEETKIKEKLDEAHENVKTVPQVVNWKAVVPGNITQVVATNDASFALTENGNVYGWGTFKVSLVPLPLFTNSTFPNASSHPLTYWFDLGLADDSIATQRR